MKKQHLFYLAFFGALFLILAGCMKKQSYPETPEISLIGFETVSDTAQVVRYGILGISYQDGDGNIGLDPGDTFPPYDRNGPYYYNYVINYFEKQNGVFNQVDLTIPFSLRIPVLTPDDPGRAIKGFMYDTMSLYPPPLHDTIKFEVFIYDRSLNKSNVITTPEIILKRH
ncbi:MAG: hypothetical protein NTU98_15220 [Bacteroidetes bacterium]|nr:hypothetical protein [Bacteroidota bacterium]